MLHFSGGEEDSKHITSEEAIRSAETSWWTVKVLSQAWWELREREKWNCWKEAWWLCISLTINISPLTGREKKYYLFTKGPLSLILKKLADFLALQLQKGTQKQHLKRLWICDLTDKKEWGGQPVGLLASLVSCDRPARDGAVGFQWRHVLALTAEQIISSFQNHFGVCFLNSRLYELLVNVRIYC